MELARIALRYLQHQTRQCKPPATDQMFLYKCSYTAFFFFFKILHLSKFLYHFLTLHFPGNGHSCIFRGLHFPGLIHIVSNLKSSESFLWICELLKHINLFDWRYFLQLHSQERRIFNSVACNTLRMDRKRSLFSASAHPTHDKFQDVKIWQPAGTTRGAFDFSFYLSLLK